jgi:hypothetical protein
VAGRFLVFGQAIQARIPRVKFKSKEELHHEEEEPERTGTGDYRQFAAGNEQASEE